MNTTPGEMMTVAQALQEFPDLTELVKIREAGWVFRHMADDSGELCGVVGMFHWPQYTDALWVFDLNDAVGVRILDEDYGGGVVWRRDSGLVAVIHELRDLPEPDHRLAPRLVKATSLLWTP